MIRVFMSNWALLLGMLLLMLGNGMQATLLGLRGDIEGFSATQMSFVMSAYFLGFLFGSRLTPELIRRVGHVRVFAAFGSLVSAALIFFPVATDPIAWALTRVVVGLCFSGLYITAESWLNNTATNDTRGQTLSLYMIMQMAGVVAAQGMLNIADPGGFVLFIVASVLVSLSFTPILLSISPTPAFDSSKNMKMHELLLISPLGAVGMFLLGGLFAAQFGMSAVFAAEAGLDVRQISIFVATFYIAATLLQYPVGWLSDRMDRRVLIMFSSACVGGAAFLGMVAYSNFALLLVSAAIIGGLGNPLYSLIIAYVNDYVALEDMAAVAGGLMFINGLGAIAGPLIIGASMSVFGPGGFFLMLLGIGGLLALYAAYRMTKRAAPSVDETAPYAPIAPSSTAVVVEVATEYATETYEAEQEAAAEEAAAAEAEAEVEAEAEQDKKET